MRNRSMPASTMYAPNSHPSAWSWSRKRHSTRNISIATSFFDDGDEIKLMLKNMFLNPYGLVSRQEERDAAWPTAKLAVLLIVLVLLIVSEYSFIADHFPGAGVWAQGLIGARH